METATLPPGEALPYKSNGGARKMLVVPFRGSFVGWYRLGWENLKWLIRIKIYDNTFKKSLRKKYSKVIFITIKICSSNYILFCCWGVEMNLGHAHKTRFWYLLGVFAKFSDEHPRHFYKGSPPDT